MKNHHLSEHVRKHHLRGDDTLHVIGVISNPVRYHSRYRIAREWIEQMRATAGVRLHMVEAAYKDRDFEVTDENDIRLVTESECWIKEGMVNIGARHAIARYNAKYIAWVDADIIFRDPDWALKTVHELQHFEVVQPWSDCADLGFAGNILRHYRSFGHQHQKRIPKQTFPAEPYPYAHSGFAWACTRRFWENTHGLLDFAPLGSADHHMAFAMIGEVDRSVHKRMSHSFKRRCHEWQRRAMRVTHGEVGYVPGRIEHMFHGPKARRYYRERWQILIEHGYDPDQDLMYDCQGLPYIHGKPALEQAIRLYNRSRFEDSIEDS